MSAENVVIQIMGRDYQVSVQPDEKDTLQAAVEMVNDKLQKLLGKNTSGSESTAVMCALMIAHEAVVAQRAAVLDMPSYKRRIEALVKKIDAASAVHEKLF
jgi:cell division protein ZapA